MSLRVYVAGSTYEVERAERLIKRLRQRGIVVTSSWPEVVRVNGANPRNVPPAQRRAWAGSSIAGVIGSDVVWCLVPEEDMPTRGLWWEGGTGHRDGALIISSGTCTAQSVFCALGEEFPTDEAAFLRILDLAGVTSRGPE